jgi:hypothetical protein
MLPPYALLPLIHDVKPKSRTIQVSGVEELVVDAKQLYRRSMESDGEA